MTTNEEFDFSCKQKLYLRFRHKVVLINVKYLWSLKNTALNICLVVILYRFKVVWNKLRKQRSYIFIKKVATLTVRHFVLYAIKNWSNRFPNISYPPGESALQFVSLNYKVFTPRFALFTNASGEFLLIHGFLIIVVDEWNYWNYSADKLTSRVVFILAV
jgi:hypothetical protein